MEFTVGIIIILYVIFVIDRRVKRAKRWIRPKFTPSVRVSPEPRPAQNPFDAATSKPVAAPLTVRGSAYVVDGDSLVINETQIRLFGVDAPEINHPFGKNAKWALIGLCKGKTVSAEVIEVDNFGRTVAKCTLPDGRDLSAEMVSRGWAIDWPKYSGGQYKALEVPDARKKMWLADARQKGRMHVWEKFEANRNRRA